MSRSTRKEQFKKRIPIYRKKPALFCREILHFEPDEWQLKVLHDIANHAYVSVRSGQGVGKTGLEAVITLWFLTCFPFPKVVATAPTKQQLHDVLWAEINKWQSKNPILKKILKWTKTKVYMRKYEERWFATARTATKPENMQGFHEDYMLFIVDEASGVADPIMEAILGTLSGKYNKLLMCGNPTKTSGVFYDSHHKDRADYKTHKVSSLDSTRTSKENINRLIRKYGKDSDVVRIRVYGEFPKAEPDTFIALEFVELATEHEIEPKGTELHLGVDVARFGNDETVIAPRIGGKCFDLKTYQKQDTAVTTGHVIATAKEYMKTYLYLKKVVIKVDDDGVGGGVTDQLNVIIREEHLPYEIIPMGNGRKADDDEHYDNKGTEIWGAVRDWLQDNFKAYVQGENPSIQLPNDERLKSQLSTRKYRMTNRGKLALERKEDMKKRGLDSPDRADAVVLAFAPDIFNPWMDYLKGEYEGIQNQQQQQWPDRRD